MSFLESAYRSALVKPDRKLQLRFYAYNESQEKSQNKKKYKKQQLKNKAYKMYALIVTVKPKQLTLHTELQSHPEL